jgi:hypothetical protein
MLTHADAVRANNVAEGARHEADRRRKLADHAASLCRNGNCTEAYAAHAAALNDEACLAESNASELADAAAAVNAAVAQQFRNG